MKEDTIYLSHIFDETSFIVNTVDKISFDEYVHSQLYQNALIRSLEIIGEATKNLSSEYRLKHPKVPWKVMAGMRDRLIHGYFAVDHDEVWKTLTEDLPKLHREIQTLLDSVE